MSRLPVPGGDDGDWGAILNDFLTVAHNGDGTLVQGADIADAKAKADAAAISIDFLTVASFGAQGDGSTDDTAALQAALTAIPTGGGTLVLSPNKRYLISNTLTLSGRSHVRIDGHGATIALSGTSVWGSAGISTSSGTAHVAALHIVDCNDLIVTGLTIDGNGAALAAIPTSSPSHLILIESTWASKSDTAVTSNGVTVANCRFLNARSYAVTFRLVTNATCRDSTFQTAYQDAGNVANWLSFIRCQHVRVLHNAMDGGFSTSSSGMIGSHVVVQPGRLNSGDPYSTDANGLGGVNYYAGFNTFTAPAAGAATSAAVVTLSASGTQASASNTTNVSPAIEMNPGDDYSTFTFLFACADPGTDRIIPAGYIACTSYDVANKNLTFTRYSDVGAYSALAWAGQTIYWSAVNEARMTTDVLVEGNYFANSGSAGAVYFNGVNGYRIANNHATNIHDIAYDAEWSENGSIENNTATAGAAGNNNLASVLYWGRNQKIVGNVGIGLNINAYSGTQILQDIDISHNSLTGGSIRLVSGVAYQTYNGNAVPSAIDNLMIGVTIANNTLEGAGSYYSPPISGDGIQILNNVTIPDGAGVHGFVRNVNVVGNSIGGYAGYGLNLASVQNAAVRDNVFSNIGRSGIHEANTAYQQSVRVVVEKNSFSNIGYKGTSGYGIYNADVAWTSSAPLLGQNIWLNPNSALDGSQYFYLVGGTAAQPSGPTYLPLGDAGLRAVGQDLQISSSSTREGLGNWSVFGRLDAGQNWTGGLNATTGTSNPTILGENTSTGVAVQGNSAGAQAGYFAQSQALASNTSSSVLYAGKSGTLGGFTSSGAVIQAQDNSSTTGNLYEGLEGSTTVWKVDKNGGSTPATPIGSTSGNYSVSLLDGTIKANAGSSALTVTLLDAAICTGHIYTVLKTDVTANVVTIGTTGGQLINGASTYPLSVQYQYVKLQSDGAAWWIVGK